MNVPFTDKKLSCVGQAILWIAILVGAGFCMSLGQESKGDISPLAVLGILAVVLLCIFSYGKQLNKKNSDEIQLFAARNKALNSITEKHNKAVEQMKHNYDQEKKQGGNKEQLRRMYEQLYFKDRKSFAKERDTFLNSWDKANSTPLRNYWQWAIVVGFACILFSCSFSMGMELEEENTINALMDNRAWGADNIPMPHMQDHSLYLSNPDSIISPQVEDSINATLGRLDDVLDIESAMIIVGHIKDDDPVAMVRGVYNRYGVGRNNRGVVIVVGYLDHSYFIAPGRNLEADLTDAECKRLAETYLIPSMRAEQPDSGMLYLARGLYSLMAGKEMPVMASLTAAQDDSDDSGFLHLGAYALLLILWAVLSSKMSSTVGWSTSLGVLSFLSNPFMASSSASGFSSGRSSSRGSSWGGGGGRSGGYGGGSWGGGGAGGRW